MAPKYDSAKMQALSDTEKLRLMIAYANHNEPNNVDWASAAAQAGSKTKESFRVMFHATLKKIKADNDGEGGHTDATATEVVDTAVLKADKKRGAAKLEEGATENETAAPKARKKRGAVKHEGEATENETAPKKQKTTRKPRGKKAAKQFAEERPNVEDDM